MEDKENSICDVFISYSHEDYIDANKKIIPNNEVSKIKDALCNANISYWFDEKGIIPGEDYAAKILQHIKACKVFVFLSSKSAGESEWTPKEIACALMHKKRLIPVLLDDSPFNDAIMLRIVDLQMIDYYRDPVVELEKLISSIKTHLAEEERKAKKKSEDEEIRLARLKQEELFLKEEAQRQKQVENLESEISAEESRLNEYRKVVLLKENELKLARLDVANCEEHIQKLQAKLKMIGIPIQQISNNDPIISVLVGRIKFNMIRVENACSSFYIGETAVTQALWESVMESNPSSFKGEDRPVESVSWFDCMEFIEKINAITGMNFRLPKEKEWDYAAKGGNNSQGFEFSGSNDIDEVAWYDKNACDGVDSGSDDYGTHNVKMKAPNELGIYDMSGNVWEWCDDLYDTSDSLRVLRGGSWYNYARDCSVLTRINFEMPNIRNNFSGLRLAL